LTGGKLNEMEVEKGMQIREN